MLILHPSALNHDRMASIAIAVHCIYLIWNTMLCTSIKPDFSPSNAWFWHVLRLKYSTNILFITHRRAIEHSCYFHFLLCLQHRALGKCWHWNEVGPPSNTIRAERIDDAWIWCSEIGIEVNLAQVSWHEAEVPQRCQLQRWGAVPGSRREDW